MSLGPEFVTAATAASLTSFQLNLAADQAIVANTTTDVNNCSQTGLAAGTYLCLGQLTWAAAGANTTSDIAINAGGAVVATAETSVFSQSEFTQNVAAIVTVGAAATIKLQCRTLTNASTAKAAAGQIAGNVATGLSLIKIA